MGYLFENINKLLSIFYQKNKNRALFCNFANCITYNLRNYKFFQFSSIISLMINENLIYENEYINKIYNFFEFENKGFYFYISSYHINFLISTLTSILIIFLQQKFIYRVSKNSQII